jgi:hypothetical protein
MAKRMRVAKVDVWTGTMADKPGALARKLGKLAAAKANLKFVLARRSRPGRGVLFAAPLKAGAAKKAGLKKSPKLKGVCVAGLDRPGLGAKMTGALAEAGINIRGLSAAVVGREFVAYLALDSAADANRAVKALKAM